MKQTYLAVIGAGLLLMLISGCLPSANDAVIAAGSGESLAGFWLGLWHGFIVIVTFVISLFSDTVNVYEVHNNGGWYNFGFVLGLMVALGGGGKSTNRRPKAS